MKTNHCWPLLIPVLLAGCSSVAPTASSPAAPPATTAPAGSEQNDVVAISDTLSLLVLDSSLTDSIRIPRAAFDGTNQVGARFKNISTSAVNLRVRTLFKNTQAVTVSDSGYSDFTLQPGGETAYYATAPLPSCERALLCLSTTPSGPISRLPVK